jgi:hypothetical protein
VATLDQLQLELSALRAEFNRQLRPAIQALLNEANNGATRDQIYDRYQSLYAAVISTSKQLNRIKSDADAIRSEFGVPAFIATVDDVASRIPLQQTDLDTALSTATRNTNTDSSTSQAASGGTATTPETQGGASAANPANANTAAGGNPTPTNTVVSPTGGAENQSAAETARLNRQARAASPGGTENQSAAETARLNRQAGAILPNAIANPNNAVTTAGYNQTAGSNDDASPSMSQTTRSAAAATANSLGIDTGPLPNPLDKYPSYTYNLGLYILTPEDYNKLVESDNTSETISFPGDQLLIRSGGGPVGQGKRNSYFSDCDFVLDNLKIDSVIGFSEQGIPSSVGRISFTVTEPLGATFIYRLQSATAELSNKDPNSANQYFNHTYALVIRFYGYDSNGNPITPRGDINQLDQAGSSESAVTTKIFLFMLSDLKTRIGARIVEYQIQGLFSSSMPARTAILGVSPTHYTVTGANLNDIFNGVPGSTNTSATTDNPRAESTDAEAQEGGFYGSKASGQPSQNIPVRGLCQAINTTLSRLANPQGQEVKSIQIPDEYEVLFASEKLRSAKVLIPETDNSKQNSAGSATTGSASTKAENTRKNTSVSKYAKNFQIQQGQPIIQWLDFMIRNSDYIKNQAAFTIKESADADIQGDEDFYGKKLTSQTPVRWYKITPFNKILGYDRLRKTYAQKIIYVISDYQVISARSPYFKRAPWRGPDKLYNFTFTGQNVAIIDYEQEFNALYIETFGFGASLDLDPAKQKAQSSGQVGPSFAFRVVAGAGKQGSLGQATDPAARAAAGLYSFTDLAKVKIKIVGDPDLLLQDWYNVNQALINRQNLTQSPGGNDSNILNSNHGQLYFQVTFLTGDDYNLSQGIVRVEPKEGVVRRQSNAYELVKVVSEFQNGKFTQDIHGLILADVNPEQSFVEGDYTTGAAGQTATGAPVDQVTDTDSSTARQETTQASQETGAFDTDGSNDLRTQEGGSSSVPQSPSSALPAPPPPFSSPLASRLQELGIQRDQFRRGLLPNQAQVGNDDAPPDTPYG